MSLDPSLTQRFQKQQFKENMGRKSMGRASILGNGKERHSYDSCDGLSRFRAERQLAPRTRIGLSALTRQGLAHLTQWTKNNDCQSPTSERKSACCLPSLADPLLALPSPVAESFSVVFGAWFVCSSVPQLDLSPPANPCSARGGIALDRAVSMHKVSLHFFTKMSTR